MRTLSRKKLLDSLTKRKNALYDQLTRDFGGGLGGRFYEHGEVKIWKEAIERGEFDTELPEVFIILTDTEPGIVDRTFYTEKSEVQDRVKYLNSLTNKNIFWYISLFSNVRNMGNDGDDWKN